MSEMFYGLAVLACPVAMGAMMWFMMRGRKDDTAPPPAASDELQRMRTEIDQLRAAGTSRTPAER